MNIREYNAGRTNSAAEDHIHIRGRHRGTRTFLAPKPTSKFHKVTSHRTVPAALLLGTACFAK